MATREWVHLVTGSYFRLRNEDDAGGHTIRSARKLRRLCAIEADFRSIRSMRAEAVRIGTQVYQIL